MKLTYTNLPRVGKSVKGISNPVHNDRRFNYMKEPHINPEMMYLNKYTSIYDSKEEGKVPFDEAELRYYKEHLQEQLQERNKKAESYGRKDRVKTMDQFRKMPLFSPEETLVQLGNRDDQPEDKEILKKLVVDMLKFIDKKVGRNAVILDMAYHADEETPHVHIRKLWVYYEEGRDGKEVMKVGQEKALEQAGIPVYDPSRPPGKFNSRKMAFDHMVRNELFRLCKERGLEIDTVPNKKNRKKMPIREFKEFMKRQEMEREVRRQDRATG